ncbi:MAG: DUF1116 domain-containing protein [Rhizobiales bacterium]|nr:DUF1116 domain-containing protein [Hyphomicrobiales bacterium]
MPSSELHPADRLAFDRAVTAQPVWNRLQTAADAFGLERNVLLHAGPAFRSAASISPPILNSATVAAVYEGLAPDFERAEDMIRAGEIVLRPAQDHGVVTPLAAVVSASMPLHAVYDAHRGQVRTFAPINGGSRPALRLGQRSMVVLEHIRWLNDAFCETLERGIAEGIGVIPLAVAGLSAGDDCHGRTVASTAAWIEELEERSPGGIRDAAALEFMRASPSLFLNLWMAATKCIMTVASGVAGSGLVTAAGGNGQETGIQVSGLPGRWFIDRAGPPVGRLDVAVPNDRVMGAVGDSAVVEAFGLGAMAIDTAPEQMKGLGEFLPVDAADRRAHLRLGIHPYFRALDVRLGVSARAAAGFGRGPVIALGMIDRTGEKGRLGGGIYDMPVNSFAAAAAALDEKGAHA